MHAMFYCTITHPSASHIIYSQLSASSPVGSRQMKIALEIAVLKKRPTHAWGISALMHAH